MDILQNHVKRLQDLLGIPLYAVGGCVRDTLLRRPIKDYDFTCKEKPDEIENAIMKIGKRAYTIGKRFGTLSFKDDELGMIEITTFRGETYTPGSRKPEVDFVADLPLDLSRRDFTINALAMDSMGKIHDEHGGLEDMEKQSLKCVGDPIDRFTDDPLRILRCTRFAVELGYNIDGHTKKTIESLSYQLLNVSKERIVTEIDRMFTCSVLNSFTQLLDNNILQVLFPELCANKLEVRHINDSFAKLGTDNGVVNTICGWAMVLEVIATGVTFSSTDENDVNLFALKRSMVYKDLVNKYALHLKFSKMRTGLLQQWDLSTSSAY